MAWPLGALVRQGHRRELPQAQGKNRLKQPVLFLGQPVTLPAPRARCVFTQCHLRTHTAAHLLISMTSAKFSPAAFWGLGSAQCPGLGALAVRAGLEQSLCSDLCRADPGCPQGLRSIWCLPQGLSPPPPLL